MKTSCKNVLSVLCLLGIMQPLLHAQSTTAADSFPPPKAPFVVPIPSNGQWTISLTYPDNNPTQGAPNSGSKPKHRIKQIVCTKTQNLKRDVEVYDDGTSEVYWFSGNLILVPDASAQEIRIIDFDQTNRPVYGEAGNPIESPGFTGVKWVQLKYYDKVVSMQGVPCYHFALGTMKASSVDPESASATGDMEAWINAKTGYPVSYRTKGVTYDYSFGNPPESDLVLPDKYATALAAYQKIQDKRKQLQKALGW